MRIAICRVQAEEAGRELIDIDRGGDKMTSDETLMLEFQRGSREALEELFARYRQPLFGFFRRRLANKERAEDLAQETFVAVIRAAARYEPRSMVCTYLYGIALRLLANERRKQSKNPRSPDMVDQDGRKQDGAATLDAIPDPKAAGAADTVLWVRQALEKLEPVEREVLMLREYEQLSYEDIAQLLRIPINTVRSRLFRARMALKERLQPDAAADKGEKDEKAADLAGQVNPNPAESEA
ncbi:MAG: sigma-70 family RNA polymerase sigma factor [Acidobacteriia bacterium]|nr:sigma-70 family RNA polymerase sigma factor [Terriglobia bacterium]